MKSIVIHGITSDNLRMTDFTLRQLRQFVAISQAGSFTGAAKDTHLSASALAASLDELERVLGVVLCTRRKAHGIGLTADGRNLLRQATELLGNADELALSVSSRGEPSGPLLLGCYTTLAPTVVPALIESFTAEYPAVQFKFVEAGGDELQYALESGHIDAAIMYDRDVSGDYATTTLYGMRPHVLLSAEHRLAGAPTVSFAELATEPMVLLDLVPSAQHTLSLLSAAGVKPVIAHRTSSYELTRALVARGLGYGVLVQRTRASVSYEGRGVVIKELDPAPPVVGVVLVRTRANGRNARIDALETFAKAHSEVFHAPNGASL